MKCGFGLPDFLNFSFDTIVKVQLLVKSDSKILMFCDPDDVFIAKLKIFFRVLLRLL